MQMKRLTFTIRLTTILEPWISVWTPDLNFLCCYPATLFQESWRILQVLDQMPTVNFPECSVPERKELAVSNHKIRNLMNMQGHIIIHPLICTSMSCRLRMP